MTNITDEERLEAVKKIVASRELKTSMNKYYTSSLFYEARNMNDNDSVEPFLCLKDYDIVDKDGKVYYSLKKLFLMFSDPTEYSFATEVFGSYRHWTLILKSKVMARLVDFDDWRTELDVKLASEAIRSMIHTATNEGSKGTTAAKYVAEAKWRDLPRRGSSTGKVGRPNKKEKFVEKLDEEIADDLRRLELVK